MGGGIVTAGVTNPMGMIVGFIFNRSSGPADGER